MQINITDPTPKTAADVAAAFDAGQTVGYTNGYNQYPVDHLPVSISRSSIFYNFTESVTFLGQVKDVNGYVTSTFTVAPFATHVKMLADGEQLEFRTSVVLASQVHHHIFKINQFDEPILFDENFGSVGQFYIEFVLDNIKHSAIVVSNAE